jgi:hypothetical protein
MNNYLEDNTTPLIGDGEYWNSLGIMPNQTPININNIDALLNNSKQLLRHLNNRVEDDRDYKNTAEYTLYRSLLLRQLSVLVHQDDIDVAIKSKIKVFVSQTLLLNPDEILDDLYYFPQSAELDSGLALVAGNMRLSLSYDKPVVPIDLLDTCIEDYVRQFNNKTAKIQSKPIVFGDANLDTLNRFNYVGNDHFFNDIVNAIEDTKTLLTQLKQPPQPNDSWNNAPIDLYPAYKNMVTKQTLLLLESLVNGISRCNPDSDSMTIHKILDSYHVIRLFLLNNEYCFSDTSHDTNYQLLVNLPTDPKTALHEIVRIAHDIDTQKNLTRIFKQNYGKANQENESSQTKYDILPASPILSANNHSSIYRFFSEKQLTPPSSQQEYSKTPERSKSGHSGL